VVRVHDSVRTEEKRALGNGRCDKDICWEKYPLWWAACNGPELGQLNIDERLDVK
jgi:hypothetical protein